VIKVIRGIDGILLGSENAEKLAEFYREIVGLKQEMEFEMGDAGEKGFSFDLGGVSFVILDHSSVKGKNKGPERFMVNFEVSDLEREVNRLKNAKVKIEQEIYHVEGYGLVATLEDPDGNFFQMVQVKASN
jgi:predicted enzyme related to lactoylglutathione lyase